MAKTSAIGWTQATWNPWTGCAKVSAGCEHCYAEAIAERFRGTPNFPNGFDLTMRPERTRLPLTWKEPREVFVNSMSDLFLGSVDAKDIAAVWETMLEANWHLYQVLTKRPGRARWVIDHLNLPLPAHIWLGVSAEDQATADHRIPVLLDIPAPLRFLSCEPLLGPIDLGAHLQTGGIHWVIDGGESGPGRRPADYGWFRSIRDQCLEFSVPYFHKQGNAPHPGKDRMLEGRAWDGHPNRTALQGSTGNS